MRLSSYDRRYRPPAESRTIGGKRYLFLQMFHLKTKAQQDAERQRKRGLVACVMKVHNGWGVYIQKG